MEWNLAKIEGLIKDKIEENLNLDYKASESLQRNDKKANEISKDVSAFANSDGGIIIYGISEDQENKHLPGSIDPIDRKLISKEWLEQIIQSRIRPRIENIIIHPITVNEENNQVIYVVEIPQSNTAHQASDKKYYKRFNFNSEPMYDFEIRDILNRTKYPIIELEFLITENKYEIKQDFPQFPAFTLGKKGFAKPVIPQKKYKSDYFLHIYARNNGKILANFINAYVFIDKKYLLDKGNTSEKNQIYMDNTIRDIVDVKTFPTLSGSRSIPQYGPSRYDPILPTRRMKLKKIMLDKSFLNTDESFTWIVYSDNSEPRNGKINFNQIQILKK